MSFIFYGFNRADWTESFFPLYSHRSSFFLFFKSRSLILNFFYYFPWLVVFHFSQVVFESDVIRKRTYTLILVISDLLLSYSTLFDKGKTVYYNFYVYPDNVIENPEMWRFICFDR